MFSAVKWDNNYFPSRINIKVKSIVVKCFIRGKHSNSWYLLSLVLNFPGPWSSACIKIRD